MKQKYYKHVESNTKTALKMAVGLNQHHSVSVNNNYTVDKCISWRAVALQTMYNVEKRLSADVKQNCSLINSVLVKSLDTLSLSVQWEIVSNLFTGAGAR